MLVLRYHHRLPADYAMARIRSRILERGPLWDATPGLGFKAFSVSEAGRPGQAANGYASTYLWLDPREATAVLTDDRFQAVIAGFGRPRVETWLPLAVAAGAAEGARILVQEDLVLDVACDLARLRADERDWAAAALTAGAGAAVSALDAQGWRLTRFTLRPAAAEALPHESILHLSAPGWARLAG